MLQKIYVLISGIIFGLGLTISNMTNPAKVLGFLDLFGIWDPSLILVMGGAILIASPLLFFLKTNSHFILVDNIKMPNKNNIDLTLICGAILFGIGWGSVGFCPGPAISSIAFFNPFGLLFVASLAVGFYISNFIK